MGRFLREVGSEWGLIAFTVLAPASVGMALLGLVSGAWAGLALGAWAAASLAMLASFGHLARPWLAPLSVSNWLRSWLSREIVAAAAFWGCTLLWWLASGSAASLAVNLAAVAAGVVLLYTMGRAYQLSTRPAWNGVEGWAELAAGALGPGIIAGAWLLAARGGGQPGWAVLALPFLGLALVVWAYATRRRRLAAGAADDRRVAAAAAHWAGLAAYQRASLILLAAGAVLAVRATLVGVLQGPHQGWQFLWAIALFVAVAGQALCRALFYASATAERYVARVRPPFGARAQNR